MVAFESLHFLRNRRRGKKGFYALKLDMSKAYDRVEWDFLEELLNRMQFPSRWIYLIMQCVRSVKYSILLNGIPLPEITPSRRQGDPLSPYLFVLCTELFSFLLDKAHTNGRLSGVKVARSAPSVSHLFFVNDSLLFGTVADGEISCLLDILHNYGFATGQQINFDKSAVCFSSNTSRPDRSSFCQSLKVGESAELGRYLGMPSFVGRNKVASFSDIKDRIWNNLFCWSAQLLSSAGKEVSAQY